ncbi:cystathionine beta-lyase [Scenedesmus sp. NREL 46B-D3]|nr:cystathionine beta-lyase [Scenedesmus sp. NREL 46B-D3]
MASKADTGSAGKAAAAGASASQMKLQTLLLHPAASSVTDPYDASGPPLYQTATFGQPSATEGGQFDYTRSGNPTRTMLEEQASAPLSGWCGDSAWAALEGGCRALAFTSGMAALAVATKLVSVGAHIVAGDDIYGGTSRLLAAVVPAGGVSVSNVDMTDISAVKAAIIPGKTQLVMVESPTNPRMQICDIKAIAAAAHVAGALVCVDNSFLTPLYQRPLDLGADISMTSGTKYIGGHGDTTLGMLAVRDAELGKKLYFLQNTEGAGLAPMDCWLALRGLKTMALRMERSVANAEKIAEFLAGHPLVRRLNYAGRPQHPGAGVHAAQASSGGAMISFETGDLQASKMIVELTKLYKVTVSFGNVISLISLPCFMSHASIPAEVRAARGLPDDLVRISVGIEDAADLIADLQQAMDAALTEKRRREASSSSSGLGRESTGGVSGAGGSGNGNGNGAGAVAGEGAGTAAVLAAAHSREQELVQRIQHLESQLAGLNGQVSKHV